MSTTTNILLPDDVVMDILSRLPVKSVLRFRCVSKPWKIFLSDPSFIKMHLKHSINNNYEHLMVEGPSVCSIAANNSNESSLADEVVEINDYPLKSYPSHTFPLSSLFRVTILGSCDGLLLIHSVDKDCFIWNPSTKEFKKLPKAPKAPCQDRFDCSLIEHGFGYDEITEDYKVVLIILYDTDGIVELRSVVYSEVMVYSLRSNCWRKSSQDLPYKLDFGFAGILVNGALHWVAENSEEEEENESIYTIVSFNLGDEKHRVIEPPIKFIKKIKESYLSLNVLGGCLYIIRDFYGIRSEIWVMKDYGVKESWTKLFNISLPTVIESYLSVRPIKFTKNGEVVFEKDKHSLFVYDPKHGTAKTLQIRGLKGRFETYTYVESLISLNSGTFVGQEHLTLEETRALESKLYNWEMEYARRR